MKKTLVAQTVAAAISGLALVGGVNAAVVGPYTDADPLVLNETVADANTRTGLLPATALQVNTDGIGHIVVVPYYSVQNGNDTYINIVNTDRRNGKAVKVRFRGASNSDDVFDFTVLMSPGDVFAAAVTKGADGLPRLVHNDKTCTLPGDVKRSFVTSRLNPDLTDAQKAVEASEGYVEILNMADIPPTVAYDADDTATYTLFNMIKHVNGVPRNCAATSVTNLSTDPANFPAARNLGLDVATSGLMANWTIINVARSSSYTGAGVAVEARDGAGVTGWANVVVSPQAAGLVALGQARVQTSDPLLRGGMTDNSGAAAAPGTPPIAAAQYDFPDLSTPYLNGDLDPATGLLPAAGAGLQTKRQAFRLTQALAVTSTTNEFVTDPGLLAKTDWVFSMPTRRYNVARDYSFLNGLGVRIGRNLFTDYRNDDAPAAIGGQSNYFEPVTGLGIGNVTTPTGSSQICVTGIEVAGGSTAIAGQANRRAAVTGDREERFVAVSTEFVISPGQPADPLTFCGEVSVLSFNAGSTAASVLGATVARKDLTVPYTDGWVRLASTGLGGKGLPIVGTSMTLLNNGAAAPGVAATYGQTFPHRHSR